MHQIGDDDAEGVGAAEAEAAGNRVTLVAEFFDLGEDAVLVASLMSARLLSTLDTVVMETPNSPAIRFMVVWCMHALWFAGPADFIVKVT